MPSIVEQAPASVAGAQADEIQHGGSPMYASLIEVKLKPGSSEEVTELLSAMRSELEGIDGLSQLIVVDKGDDIFSEVVIYETESQWESARPKVQQLMMPLIGFLAEAPESVGGTVVMNDSFG